MCVYPTLRGARLARKRATRTLARKIIAKERALKYQYALNPSFSAARERTNKKTDGSTIATAGFERARARYCVHTPRRLRHSRAPRGPQAAARGPPANKIPGQSVTYPRISRRTDVQSRATSKADSARLLPLGIAFGWTEAKATDDVSQARFRD